MAAKKGTRLGRGLDTLIPQKTKKNEEKETPVAEGRVMVDINKIERNKQQPRKNFDEAALDELAESIKQHGIIQSIVVQDRGDHYEIIAGERRWRAARLAGLKEVPVEIKHYTEQEMAEVSLIENLQREDLNPIEEAQAFKQLKEMFSLTDDQVAEKVSKSRAAITNSLRLLKLDERVQQMVIDEMLTTGHVRALLTVTDGDRQYKLAQDAFDQKLSVREVEKLIKKLDKPSKAKKAKDDAEQYKLQYEEYARKLESKLGTKVSISLREKNSGKLEIDFYSLDDFEKIYRTLTD
ncbi:MAG: ParB/RepB/Spo0J family partition protein [Lachnospiraceae bacterium]|nr:ParB/RepB/Spo0J family partition protein [Lachnospiraceae bacterium]